MTDPLLGMMVQVVDAGTVIGQDAKGVEMVVTDNNAVVNGNRMWVTQTVWDKMKASTK